MTTIARRAAALLLCALAGLAAQSCGDGHDHDGHDHGAGGHDHGPSAGGGAQGRAGAMDEHEHEGEPVVIHDGPSDPFERLVVTWFRTPEVGEEIVFELELDGPAATPRGFVRSASGATSLRTKGDAEDEPGHFHLHLGELPDDLVGGTATLVVEFEFEDGATSELELPLGG